LVIGASLGFGDWVLGFPLKARAFSGGTRRAAIQGMHATFMQKVILCAVLGFLAAALVEWGKVFVEGADDALNGGYKTRTSDVVRP
jgi:hypothetical protein